MTERFTSSDFETEDVKNCQRLWGVSDEAMAQIERWMTGAPVTVQLTEEAMQKGKWVSSKQYMIYSTIVSTIKV